MFSRFSSCIRLHFSKNNHIQTEPHMDSHQQVHRHLHTHVLHTYFNHRKEHGRLSIWSGEVLCFMLPSCHYSSMTINSRLYFVCLALSYCLCIYMGIFYMSPICMIALLRETDYFLLSDISLLVTVISQTQSVTAHRYTYRNVVD